MHIDLQPAGGPVSVLSAKLSITVINLIPGINFRSVTFLTSVTVFRAQGAVFSAVSHKTVKSQECYFLPFLIKLSLMWTQAAGSRSLCTGDDSALRDETPTTLLPVMPVPQPRRQGDPLPTLCGKETLYPRYGCRKDLYPRYGCRKDFYPRCYTVGRPSTHGVYSRETLYPRGVLQEGPLPTWCTAEKPITGVYSRETHHRCIQQEGDLYPRYVQQEGDLYPRYVQQETPTVHIQQEGHPRCTYSRVPPLWDIQGVIASSLGLFPG